MALPQKREELFGVTGDPGHLVRVVDDRERASNVVGIRGTVGGIPPLHDDAAGLLELELRALDEVREVRLEEGELTERGGGTQRWRQTQELVAQHIEPGDSRRVVRCPSERRTERPRGRRVVGRLPRKSIDDPQDHLRSTRKLELGAGSGRVLPQPPKALVPLAARDVDEDVLELGAAQRAPWPTSPGAARLRVLDDGASERGLVKRVPSECVITLDRPSAVSCPHEEAG